MLLLLFVITLASAQSISDDLEGVEVVTVEEPRQVAPPCRIAMSQGDVRGFPARRPEELLRAVPGMWITSRLGFGGAYSYTYRGFDGRHGRDVALDVLGVPVNEPSHVVDPGYAELHFVPMRLVEGFDVCPGATSVDDGAYATALSANLRLGLDREGVTFQLGGGSDGSGALSVGWRPPGWDRGTWVFAEIDGGEGVGDDRSWRHLRVSGGVQGSTGPVDGRAVLLLHDGVNDVPTPFREQDFDAGDLSFNDGYDEWTGDTGTRRLLLIGQLKRPWRWGGVTAGVWFGGRGFRLRENLTGTYSDPELGDGEWRRQSSFEVGLRSSVVRNFAWLEDETRFEGGVDLHARFYRQRIDALDLTQELNFAEVDRRLEHNTLAAWTRIRWGLFGVAEITPAVRIEQVDLRARSLLDGSSAEDEGDRAAAFVAAPKMSLSLRPWPNLLLHASYARGFRPPDARLVQQTFRSWFTRTDTLQGGFDLELPFLFRVAASGASVWVPDERLVHPLDGRVLETVDTRRITVDGLIAVYPHPAARIQVDGAWHDPRDRDHGDLLPFVPRWVLSGSVFADQLPIGPVTLTAGVRVGARGPMTLLSGFRTRGSSTVHASFTVGWNRWFFQAAADNLLSVRQRAAEYFYPSHWAHPDDPRSPLPVRHVVTGEPFAVRLAVGATY